MSTSDLTSAEPRQPADSASPEKPAASSGGSSGGSGRGRGRRDGGRAGLGWYTGLFALSVVFTAPLLWMVLTSFKAKSEALRVPPTWLPEEISFEAYRKILGADSQAPVLTWF
ncbi:MAG: hypothetical protein ACRDT1_07645, partial [Micromonosporaceae bacterium]